MSTTSCENIKTIGAWTLQRLEYANGAHTYVINTDGEPVVRLYVSSLPDENGRMVHTVAYSPSSRAMDFKEATKFVERAEQALFAATALQRVIDSAESK